MKHTILSEDLPLKARIITLLRNGPFDIDQMTLELGLDGQEDLREALQEMDGKLIQSYFESERAKNLAESNPAVYSGLRVYRIQAFLN